MDYGCDVSNRYTGYLDSSDHGTTMNLSTNKNKRKTKKKRKPKNRDQKLVDKCTNTNTEQPNQCTGTEQQSTTEPVEIGDTTDNQQSFSTGSKSDINDVNEPIQHETEPTPVVDFQKSSLNCDLPMQSDTTHDDVKEPNENNSAVNDLNANEMKWSVICFEEEKSLMALESQANDTDTQKAINEPELIFNEHRVYPTIYFYNSNFGNKIRRTVEWHDSGRRSKNDGDVNRINESNNLTSGERKPNRQNRYPRRTQKYQVTNKDDNNGPRNHDEAHLDDEKQSDSRNESNEHTSQKPNEYNDDSSNRREYINSKNRFNKFKHGMPERNFTRRRRPDFVRNV